MYTVCRDGIKEISSTPIKVSRTFDGHVIESYTVEGKERFFVTLFESYFCAHGDTVEEAIADAIWKDPKTRPSLDELKKEIQSAGKNRKITLSEFRLLTGACKVGCKLALKEKNITEQSMTAHEIKEKISKEWGSKLLSILEWK